MAISRIGIIGVGPRGLTILERIVANERVRKSSEVQIYLFDPNEPGVGCHDPEQSDYLLVNTVAGQITQFSDSSVVGAGPILEGPSFHQWLDAERRNRRSGHTESTAVAPDAYYSRGLFGRYLHWVYRYLVGLAPAHVKITFIKTAVARAERVEEDAWLLETKNASFCVNYLFLTTGHTKPAVRDTVVPLSQRERIATAVVGDPYPVRQKLAFITPNMTVAIEGMGLTTFDVLAELTVGRGGRFVTSGTGQMDYFPSGQEPRIVAFSRSGLPLTARAVNQKGVSIQYRPRFLFADKLRELRAKRKLDFADDVLPLLRADMEYAYYEAYLRDRRDPVSALLFLNQFVCADAAERLALIAQYVPGEDRFSWERLLSPIPPQALVSHASFNDWLVGYLNQDLADAMKGNVDGPLKAACDVLRDLRDTLRAAIDFGGLTEASHRWLLSEFVPVMNRLAVGPPASRIAEILALTRAGVLNVGFGPGAVCERTSREGFMRISSSRWPEKTEEVHALIKARISMHSPQEDSSPLLRGLLDAGHLRLFHNGSFHPGGIEIDRDFNWVSKSGGAISNAWSLGIPTEGVKFYTFVVPRSSVNSTAIVDAGRAVTKMLSMINGPMAVPLAVPESTIPTQEYASAFASLYGALS